MTRQPFRIAGLFPSLQNKDEFYESIAREEHIGSRIRQMIILLTGLSFFYGIIMGCYSGVFQAITAGVKVPVLFFLSLLICFPAFFILQYILGSRMKLSQMTAIILSGFVLSAAIMVSFTPIVIFFVLTGGDYHFLQLLHVGIFALSGAFGMKSVLDGLKFSCEQKAIYPQAGVIVFRFWVIILAFVGIQLAWNLRPFLADRTEPYALFRTYEGNFYAAVVYSFREWLNPGHESAPPGPQGQHLRLDFDTTQAGK